jgi:hypothetical protein
MRNSSDWYQSMAKELGRTWPDELDGVKPALLCQVELGLRLMERLDPSAEAGGVYTLLGGYPFAAAAGIALTAEHQSMLTTARHLLWKLRRRRMWLQCLETYGQVPERLRGYRVSDDNGPARRVEPTILADRYTQYDLALSALPDFDRRALPLAPSGSSRFVERRRPAAVIIPEELVLDPAPGHDLTTVPATVGKPLDIPLADLAETARWMDHTEQQLRRRPGSWAKRLNDLQLDMLSADRQSFQEATVLRLDRLLHLVGMVGAGKSTMMILIAVWGARLGLRITLVVGDVAEQLTLTNLFRDLGLPAVPVLGGTTRERHAGRLHRRLAARGHSSLLSHTDPGFDDLSTVCVVDALRGMEAAEPLRFVDAPCTSLRPERPAKAVNDDEIRLPTRYPSGSEASSEQPVATSDDDRSVPPHGCPIWGGCPRHNADRDMVDALIWVANPASLMQSAVPQHLNEERLRRLELACLRSDIVIVDEADRVQMQLDTAFAPAATLVIRGPESWLDRLHTHKIAELAQEGRLPLAERDVERWSAALEAVSLATNRLYAMLISNADLRKWADIEYFSAWTLQEKLIASWYPQPGELDGRSEGTRADTDVFDDDEELDPDTPRPAASGSEPWAQRRQAVISIFDDFRDDPLGDRGPYRDDTQALINGVRDLLHTLNETGTRQRIRAILDGLLLGSPLLDGSLQQPQPTDGSPLESIDTWGTSAWRQRNAVRLEFTLLLATLHHRLDRVSFMWPQVEAALHLDTTDNELARRPPLDYAPVVPEAPMGNVLGFQYLPDEPAPGGDERRSGTLRFFRCAGVGRELLLNLPALGADPANGRPGPHVLLMSGTSWAGTSTRAHLLVPVGAVLKPDERALNAIRKTTFATQFLYDSAGAPLRLSGTRLQTRPAVLRQMVTRLGKATAGQSSILDQELRRIQDVNRRRALLLVGSYREAAAAANLLQEMPRWSGKVRVLVGDDAELDGSTYSGAGTADDIAQAGAVRRGDLASFADDPDAELLVAPLMAIERGHNILNAQRTAAFGVVLFLARPHPRPDDLTLAIFAINDWVTRFVRDQPDLPTGTFSKLVTEAGNLEAAGLAFRHLARREWRRLLSRHYAYSRLNEAEKVSFVWDQMVTIWQVIGRLVRGGVPARVVFVDAAFAPALADARRPPLDPSIEEHPGRGPRRRTDVGLLITLHDVLAPYFDPTIDPHTFPNPADPALVRMLYQPLYDALSGLRAGVAPAVFSPNPDAEGPNGCPV